MDTIVLPHKDFFAVVKKKSDSNSDGQKEMNLLTRVKSYAMKIWNRAAGKPGFLRAENSRLKSPNFFRRPSPSESIHVSGLWIGWSYPHGEAIPIA